MLDCNPFFRLKNIVNPRTESFLSILSYSLCSTGLLLINKLILRSLPYPGIIISFQLFATIIIILSSTQAGFIECDPIQWKFITPYLPYTIVFSLGLYCNMKSLQQSDLESVILFRTLAPYIVSFLDAIFLGREYPSTRSFWFGLLIFSIGAFGYAMVDPQFDKHGVSAYYWPTLYCIVISFKMVYGKRSTKSVKLKTISGSVLYTNLLGFGPMLLFAFLGNEFQQFWTDMWLREDARLPQGSISLLIISLILGTLIGYSSWWCRDKLSATSFTIIGVLNKWCVIVLNILLWGTNATAFGIASLFLCLVGASTLYCQAFSSSDFSRRELVPLIFKDDDVLWDSDAISIGSGSMHETPTKDTELVSTISSYDSRNSSVMTPIKRL